MGRLGRLARLAPIVATVAVVGACGGSSPRSPGDQARAVVEHFYADIADGKGAQACALLTPAAREEIVRPLRRLPKGHNLNCETLLRDFSQGGASFAKGVKVGAASVKGDRATVVVTVPDQGLGYAPLAKTPSGWQISHIITSVRKPIEG
jgi:hypothetical protein